MTSTTELNQDYNALTRFFRMHGFVSALIVLNVILIILVALSAARADRAQEAGDAARTSNEQWQRVYTDSAQTWATAFTQSAGLWQQGQADSNLRWQTAYDELEREFRICQNDIDDFRVALALEGIELDHVGATE